MKYLWQDLIDNVAEAVQLLNDNGRYHEFKNKENVPFVLMSDRHDMIQDLEVTKIRLNKSDVIELYIPEWDEWVIVDECISTSANNVCIALTNDL